MAIKTKKAKQSFSLGITSILESYGLHLEDDTKLPLIKDILEFTENFDDTTEHWQYIRGSYCTMYKSVTGRDCAFIGGEHKALKEVAKELKKRFCEKHQLITWSAEEAVTTMESYYRVFLTLPNAQKNFCASYIFYHFDQTISMVSYEKNKSK